MFECICVIRTRLVSVSKRLTAKMWKFHVSPKRVSTRCLTALSSRSSLIPRGWHSRLFERSALMKILHEDCMKRLHGNASCNGFMQRAHAPVSCNDFMQRFHATISCNVYVCVFPTRLQRNALRRLEISRSSKKASCKPVRSTSQRQPQPMQRP